MFKECPIPVALFRVPTGARCTEPVLLGDLGAIQQDFSTGLAGGWDPGEVSSEIEVSNHERVIRWFIPRIVSRL